jgi:hypothetical protein
MYKNTDLGCNLKTILCSDRVMKAGKDYKGVMRRDIECEDFRFDEHYTFVETLPSTNGKRNPRLFEGRYITITRREDGSLNLNFKSLKMEAGFTVDGYALAVCNELRQALGGLVEE